MRTAILALSLVLGACGRAPSPEPTVPSPDAQTLHPPLSASLERAASEADDVPAPRRAQLEQLAREISTLQSKGQPVRLLFICTHNSRRSHMGQLWAAASARYFGVDGVETFSGGTEATAFNPRAVAALQRAGFEISAPDESAENPRYTVQLGEGAPAIEAFSKRYGDPPNPTKGFIAVMTCSDADASCPFVAGADARLAIPYVDPKVSDGTPEEAATYDERSRQIAREMAYVFARVGSAAG